MKNKRIYRKHPYKHSSPGHQSGARCRLSREFLEIRQTPPLSQDDGFLKCVVGGGGKPMLEHTTFLRELEKGLQGLDASHMTGSIVIQVESQSTVNDAQSEVNKRLSTVKEVCSQQGYNVNITAQKITRLAQVTHGLKKGPVLKIKSEIELTKIE